MRINSQSCCEKEEHASVSKSKTIEENIMTLDLSKLFTTTLCTGLA